MRVLILGATGNIGTALVKEALERGLEVTVLVRAPHKIEQEHPRLKVLQGDPLDEATLTGALPGHDSVITALGPRGFDPSNIRETHICALVNAMTVTQVSHLLVVSVSFLFPDAGLPSLLLGRTLFRNVVQDARNMENVILASDLEWTIVRPPRVTNGARTGRYRVDTNHLPRGGFIVSRGDVSEFMINALIAKRHLHEIVGICQ